MRLPRHSLEQRGTIRISTTERARSGQTADRVAPFFAAGTPSQTGNRLLLVSYCFPPDASMGALRWEKLIAFASRRGWEVDVIMMDPGDAELRDDARLASMPEGTRLYAVKLRQHRLMSFERWMRRQVSRLRRRSSAPPVGAGRTGASGYTGPLVGPGLRGRLHAIRRAYLAWLHYAEWDDWARRAADVGLALATTARYSCVASSGPPHLAHEAARRIGQRIRVPFVMDLRDQFFADDSQPLSLRSRTWHDITKRYEHRCVAAASLVVASTRAIEEIMRGRYPAFPDRFITVMNGADPDIGSTRPLASRFTLIHAGSLYNGRDPRALLRGVRRALEVVSATPAQLQVRFMGDDAYDGVPIARIAEEEGVAEYVVAERARPRADAIRAQEESAVLVVLPQIQEECIPGKVFEYVQLSSWLLLLSGPGSASELLLRGTSADIASPSDSEAVGGLIAARYRDFQAGLRPSPVNADGRFDRDAQATLLFARIERLVAGGDREHPPR